jgi:hypothetical protein
MRKFLVKHFVLDYFFTVLGKQYNAPRASIIIYPLMALCGWFTATNYDYPTPSIGLWFLYALLSLSLFFGFIYFRIYPAKWDELDNLQKLQYGFFNKHKMTIGQLKEWKIIKLKF